MTTQCARDSAHATATTFYELHRSVLFGVIVMREVVDTSMRPVRREGYSLSTCIIFHIEAISPEEVIQEWVKSWNGGDPPVELQLVPVAEGVWNATYRVQQVLNADDFLTKQVHEAKLAADRAGYGRRESFQHVHAVILTLMSNIGYSVTSSEVWEALEAVSYPAF
jgi:hypothetical protein